MAERDPAAVDIDSIRIDPKRARCLQHDAGEGFIDFPQIDVVRFHACQMQSFFARQSRRGEHDNRLASHRYHRANSSARSYPTFLHKAFGGESYSGGTIANAA